MTYEQLLDVFWRSHSPVSRTWSRQYMAAVFFDGPEQERIACESRDREAARRGKQIHTQILPVDRFYIAEDYHQKYHWKQFAQQWERETAGQAPDWRSSEFVGWLANRGIPVCAVGMAAGKNRP